MTGDTLPSYLSRTEIFRLRWEEHMNFYRYAVGAAVAAVAVGCGDESARTADSAPDGQLAMASTAGMNHRPADAGPIQVYKSPT